MTNQKKQKILDKVSYLFALAENNPSEEEASSALKKAKELLIEYQLSEIDLEKRQKEMSGSQENAFEPGCIEVKLPQSRMHAWIYSMCDAICTFFDVKWFFYKGNTFHRIKPVIVIYGIKTNCNVASLAFNSVYSQIDSLSKRYKPSKASFSFQDYYKDFAIFSVQARFEYKQGLAGGLLKRARQERDRNKQQYGEQCTALAVRSEDVANEWIKSNNIILVSNKTKLNSHGTNTDALYQGIQDSGKIDVHGRGLEGNVNSNQRLTN